MKCSVCGTLIDDRGKCPNCTGKEKPGKKEVPEQSGEISPIEENKSFRIEKEISASDRPVNQEGLQESPGSKISPLIDPQIQADRIGNIFVTQGGGVKTFINNISRKSGDKDFIDPTIPLPETFSQLVLFNAPKEINSNVEKLKEKRVALLVCRNDDVLRSMAYTMVKKPDFKDYDKRMLGFTGNNAERDDLHLDIFISGNIGRGKKLMVIVEIEEQRGFFDSMFGKSLTIQSTQEILREKDIMLIVMVNTLLMQKVQKVQTASEKKQPDFLFHRWEIDFLPYLLELSFPDSTGLDKIEKKILAQRAYGLWDEGSDDYRFYRLISGYIRRGKELFQEEVKKRSEFMTSGKPPKEFIDNINKTRADELFIDNELHRTVLYTAASFNELNPVDFDQIVSLLLEKKKTSVEIDMQIITENEKVKTVKKKEEKEWVEIWEKDADKVLKECHLKTVRADDLSQFIEFSSPYLKDEVKKYIEEEYPMYHRHQFIPLLNTGLVFSPEVSSKMRENLIRLSTEMALLNPAYYGADWFIFNINQVKKYYSYDNTPVENEIEEFFQTLKNIRNNEARWQFYGYLSNLIREMLNHSELRGMISDFLNKLIESGHYDAVLEIVLQVGKRLRFSPHFDLFHWLKLLLEQVSVKVREDTRNALMDFALQSKFQIYELLDRVTTWLPKKDTDIDHYTLPNQYALLFLLDYCLFSPIEYSEFIGEWPCRYPLFYPMQKDKRLAEERLSHLVKWALHPGIQKVFDKNFPEKNFSAIRTSAHVIAVWVLILLGKDMKKTHSEAWDVFEILLQRLCLESDKKQQREILDYWGELCKFHRIGITKFSIKQKEEREEFKYRYMVLTKLITQFKKHLRLSKQSCRR